MKQQYIKSRDAYTPRVWPMLVPGMIGFAVMLLTITPPWPLGMVIGAVFGWSVVTLRFRIWKRRHPLIPIKVQVAEQMQARRDAAMWN